MKITAKSGDFAEALALAELALTGLTPELAKKIVALSAVHVRAADGVVSLTANVLDFAITVKMEAEIIEPGEIAVSLRSLSALISGFGKDVAVTVNTGKVVTIAGGAGHFRLPLISMNDMPAALELIDQVNVVELGTADLLRLLTVAAAASSEATRYYLNGIFLHTIDGDLVAVGTDAHQLMRTSIPAVVFSTDRSCVIPLKAATVIQKLVKKTGPERITLRRSKTLLTMETETVVLITKLIDGTFPAYEKIIPEASTNTITCDSGDLVAALRRLGAVATKFDKSTIAALRWKGGQELEVFLARQPNDGLDVVGAEAVGSAQIATPLVQLTALLQEIDADNITLSTDGTSPLLIKRVGDDRFLALQTLSAFNFAVREAA